MKFAHALSLLCLRVLMSYGFWTPFLAKARHVAAFTEWLARMHFPSPTFSAWLVIVLQGAAVLLLLVGLFTRPFAALLAFHMMIALLAVHWPHGFSARASGYEIPLYYVLILFSLVVYGAGEWSLDFWIRQRVLIIK